MSFCDVCGDLYRVEAAVGAGGGKGVEGLVAVCTSCGKVETVTNGGYQHVGPPTHVRRPSHATIGHIHNRSPLAPLPSAITGF
jgi:small ligand-binding sensory domain FIST